MFYINKYKTTDCLLSHPCASNEQSIGSMISSLDRKLERNFATAL